MTADVTLFETNQIRRVFDEKAETWFFSVIDIIQVLTQQADYQAARNYWKVLKNRLVKEGSQVVTNCNQLKMRAEDGKSRLTDVASAETLLRIIQSVPSPKAEPIKQWLAKDARVALENKTGKKVVTGENYLSRTQKIEKDKSI